MKSIKSNPFTLGPPHCNWAEINLIWALWAIPGAGGMDYVEHVRAANRQAWPFVHRWFIILHKQLCHKGHGNNIFPELSINITPNSLIDNFNNSNQRSVNCGDQHWPLAPFLPVHTGGASAKFGMEKVLKDPNQVIWGKKQWNPS